MSTKSSNKAVMERWGMDFVPSKPTGKARATTWAYTTENFQALLDKANDLSVADRQAMLMDYHISSVAVLRRQSGVIDKRPDQIIGLSKPVNINKADLLAKINDQIAIHQAEIQKLESQKLQLVELDNKMINMVAELLKI